jgi:hypothetical protein
MAFSGLIPSDSSFLLACNSLAATLAPDSLPGLCTGWPPTRPAAGSPTVGLSGSIRQATPAVFLQDSQHLTLQLPAVPHDSGRRPANDPAAEEDL